MITSPFAFKAILVPSLTVSMTSSPSLCKTLTLTLPSTLRGSVMRHLSTPSSSGLKSISRQRKRVTTRMPSTVSKCVAWIIFTTSLMLSSRPLKNQSLPLLKPVTPPRWSHHSALPSTKRTMTVSELELFLLTSTTSLSTTSSLKPETCS